MAAAMAMVFILLPESGRCQSRPNVLMICVDDLRPELNCFGKGYIHSPHIDALAARGTAFHRHYVQAPTCGASRFALLTGQYGPYGNGALFARGRALRNDPDAFPPTLPAWFRRHGYQTVSVGKVSHHPGGRGGSDWNDSGDPELPLSWDRHLLPAGPWLHPRGAMHGLAHGQIRVDAGDMDLFESMPGPDEIYPDGLIVEEAVRQMRKLAAAPDKPFFLAAGIIRPHLPFGAPAYCMEPYRDIQLPAVPHPRKPSGRTTWHGSGEFMKYNRWGRNPNEDTAFSDEVRRHYAACVTYADALVGRLVDELARLGLAGNTVIVLWGDHGWHLGEHAIWGKHALFEESLRSPLIIVPPGGQAFGRASDAIVETIDIYPTLCRMAGLEVPDHLHGQSLVPQLENASLMGHTAVSYTSARTIRTDRYRLIEHPDGFVELYDHLTDPGEISNIAADSPDVVRNLRRILAKRLALRQP